MRLDRTFGPYFSTSQILSQILSQTLFQTLSQTFSQTLSQTLSQTFSQSLSQTLSQTFSQAPRQRSSSSEWRWLLYRRFKIYRKYNVFLLLDQETLI